MRRGSSLPAGGRCRCCTLEAVPGATSAGGRRPPACSCRPTQALAEQARGPDEQDQDQDPEGDDVAPRRLHAGDAEVLGHAEEEAARAPPPGRCRCRRGPRR